MTFPTIHIKSGRPWWQIDYKALFAYRDLLWLLVLRDFTAIYKQSILGPAWFVLQPLATTLVFTVIFGNVAKIETNAIPPFMFYLSSMVLWTYFQGVMNGVANSLIQNSGIFGKVYFPRLIAPLALVVSNLGQFFLSFLMFIGFYVYYLYFQDTNIRPSLWILTVPILVVHCAAVGLGVGLWLSALTAKYRDIRFALPFLSQLWMFATPIVYPASMVDPSKQWVLAINPMSAIIEFNKYAFFGSGLVSKNFLMIGFASGFCLLVSGLLVFNKTERNFVDTV